MCFEDRLGVERRLIDAKSLDAIWNHREGNELDGGPLQGSHILSLKMGEEGRQGAGDDNSPAGAGNMQSGIRSLGLQVPQSKS